jgi:uncharacterized protein involved in exopolysaccharide biosynthesis
VNGGDFQDEASGGGIGTLIAQLPSILWQRRWFIIVPAVLGLVGATATAFLLPTKYQSSAVMIVQSPSLPEDVIGGEPNAAIDRRLEAIRQQIVNRPALLAMIEANQLYPDERRSSPLSEVVETMRDSITLVPEKIDLGGGQRDITISIRLAFTYEEPIKAQMVTQALMERIVEVNSTSNTEQAVQTVQFLTEQQTNLQGQIRDVEGQISALNARFGGVLAAGNTPVISGGGASFDFQIASLERENAALRSQRETLETADTRDPGVIAAEAQLAGARAIYSDNHPDVVLARKRLVEAQQLAKNNIAKLPVDTIDSQIAFNERQIAQLRAAKSSEAAQIASVLAERSRAPAVQQQAAQLQQQLSGLYEQYKGIAERLMAAQAGARADAEQLGERLLVVDPPVVPDRPSSPNRPLIVAIGVAAGLMLGLGLAMAVELFLRPVRDPKAITAITGARPLAMVPLISRKPRKESWRDRRQRRRLLRRKRKAAEANPEGLVENG